jgi:hypothetical protein
VAAKTAVELEVGPPKPYEVILQRIEAGSRAEYRRSIGRPGDSIEPNALLQRPTAQNAAPADQVLDGSVVYDNESVLPNESSYFPGSHGQQRK